MTVKDTSTARAKSPLAFFVLGFAIYIPFALYANVQVLPNWALINFGAFIPALVAAILTYRESGAAGLRDLFRRPFDYARIKSHYWYLPIVLLMPSVLALQYGWALAIGSPVSTPYFPSSFPFLFVILLIAATGEELGWMGYVFGSSGLAVAWIVWQLIYIAATRVLLVWVYKNAGSSLLAVIVMHTLFNAMWFLFPRNAAWESLSGPSSTTQQASQSSRLSSPGSWRTCGERKASHKSEFGPRTNVATSLN